jgi:hypothetical protein
VYDSHCHWTLLAAKALQMKKMPEMIFLNLYYFLGSDLLPGTL